MFVQRSDGNGARIHQKLVGENGSFVRDELYLPSTNGLRACFDFDPINGTCSTICPLDGSTNSSCGCPSCAMYKPIFSEFDDPQVSLCCFVLCC